MRWVVWIYYAELWLLTWMLNAVWYENVRYVCELQKWKRIYLNQLNMIKKPKALNFRCLSKASIFLGFITIASNFSSYDFICTVYIIILIFAIWRSQNDNSSAHLVDRITLVLWRSTWNPVQSREKKKKGLITNYCLIIQSFIIFLQLLCLRFSCESKYFNLVYVFKPVYFFQTILILPNFFFFFFFTKQKRDFPFLGVYSCS